MPDKVWNRALISSPVHQDTASTGAGAVTLGAPSGRRSFYSLFGAGGNDMFFYCISHQTAAEWELGTGHLSDAVTLVRDTVIASSNNNALVDFSAGNKSVINGIDAGCRQPFGDIP